MSSERESAETLADRQKIEEGYALVNSIWKSQGAATALRFAHQPPYGRVLPLGLDLAEVDRIIAGVGSFYQPGFNDWPSQWFKAGDEYRERGRKALGAGHKETAGQMLFSAAACYQMAGYMHHDVGRLSRGEAVVGLRAARIEELHLLAAERRHVPAVDQVPLRQTGQRAAGEVLRRQAPRDVGHQETSLS